MIATYKDTSLPLALRLDAAKAAAPYEKQRLSTTTLVGANGTALIPQTSTRTGLDEVSAIIREELGRPANKN